MEKKLGPLGGKELYLGFIAGSRRLFKYQRELNRINVFPVADADTGTNLASTAGWVMDNIHWSHSFSSTAREIASAALVGARGNSGTIFAQFWYGLSHESSEMNRLGLREFAEVLRRTMTHVYGAIANPVEGTMISVIRDWSDFIYEHRESSLEFKEVISRSLQTAKISLHNTTGKLQVLARANVVDAGAKGFVVFLEGIVDLFFKKNYRDFFRFKRKPVIEEPLPVESESPQSLRYCTEAIIRGRGLDAGKLKNIALNYGDSLVIAGEEPLVRLHLHTDKPADFFYAIRNMGAITCLKAEDMRLQWQVTHNPLAKIALVTDSACDLPQHIFDKYQIHRVPLNIHMGRADYLDRLTMSPRQFYGQLDECEAFPTTSQPNENTFLKLYSYLSEHYESVIAIHLNKKFSGTWQNSFKAAQKIYRKKKTKISVIDSRSLSGAQGMVVYRAAREIAAGADHEKTVSSISRWIDSARILVSVKTLKYMVRGGRVSPMKGLAAKILNLKPIVTINKEGNSELTGRAFSQKTSMHRVVSMVKSMAESGGIRESIVLHAGDMEKSRWFFERMREIAGKPPLGIVNISPVIGLNAGLGSVAVAFMLKGSADAS